MDMGTGISKKGNLVLFYKTLRLARITGIISRPVKVQIKRIMKSNPSYKIKD